MPILRLYHRLWQFHQSKEIRSRTRGTGFALIYQQSAYATPMYVSLPRRQKRTMKTEILSFPSMQADHRLWDDDHSGWNEDIELW
jgi:hypothetical protein